MGVPSNPAYDFGTGDFTVEAWVLPATGGRVLARMGEGSSQDIGWALTLNADGTLTFENRYLGQYYVMSSQPTVAFDGSWHHLAAVREDVNVTVYFDGIPVSAQAQINASSLPLNVTTNLPVTVGANSLIGSDTNRNCLTGSFDEVRLWNRALATWELDQQIYHVMEVRQPDDRGHILDRQQRHALRCDRLRRAGDRVRADGTAVPDCPVHADAGLSGERRGHLRSDDVSVRHRAAQ
jgi:hypothetical protein